MSRKALQINFKFYIKLIQVPLILLDHRAQCMTTTAPSVRKSARICYFVILYTVVGLVILFFSCCLVFFTLYVYYIIIKTIKTIFCVSRFFYFMSPCLFPTLYSLILNNYFKKGYLCLYFNMNVRLMMN